MITKKAAIALALVAVFIVADTSIMMSGYEADAETDSSSSRTIESIDDVRLRIYGNANGDDLIDEKDVETLQNIIDNNISDWEGKYYFADANQDGTIDSADIEVVRKIINNESVRMYYLNHFDYVSYVNYPISDKIMCDYSTFELLCATHSFNNLMAIDQSATIYIGKYDGLDECIVISTNGNNEEHTLESLTSAVQQGVGTMIQWTGGGGTNYLWEMNGIDALASELNIVTLTIQGPDCINGALMFAQMLGDITLADDYKEWYDNAMGLFDDIGTTIEKKTVTAIRCFEADIYGTYRCYGSEQSPALWLNEIINFQEAYVGKSGFTILNSLEELVSTSADEIILITQRRDGTTYDEFDSFCKERLQTLYGNTEQYHDGTIYMIEWEALPFFSGPAGCYILAAYLYPEYYDLDDAYDYLQTYLDLFSPNEDANARNGFTYTSARAVADDAEAGSGDNDDSENSPILWIAVAAVIIIAIACAAVYLHHRNH